MPGETAVARVPGEYNPKNQTAPVIAGLERPHTTARRGAP